MQSLTVRLFLQTRVALRVLGVLYRSILETYTSVKLSVREQLNKLGFASHLLLLLFRKEKNRVLPSQLYSDLQQSIKNVYFSAAKTKVDAKDSDPKFWVILQGTDELEDQFGNVRTCIGNNSNVDIQQLSNRIVGATECAQILAAHPSWDRGPRRKSLPALTFADTEITSKYDHISPSVWEGDVHLRYVDLATPAGRKDERF